MPASPPSATTSTVVVTRLNARGLRGVRGVLRQTGQVVEDGSALPTWTQAAAQAALGRPRFALARTIAPAA